MTDSETKARLKEAAEPAPDRVNCWSCGAELILPHGTAGGKKHQCSACKTAGRKIRQ